VRAAWRHGQDLLVEAALPETVKDRGGYGIHPLLLDAALQPAVTGDGEIWLPLVWSGVSLWAEGASNARVLLTPNDADIAVLVRDPAGTPVLSVDSVVMRPVMAERLLQVDRTPASGVRPRPRRRSAAAAADRPTLLAGLSAAERHRVVLDLVRGHTADVLGHTDPATVLPGAAFRELGLESMPAVELRDRLAAATGLRLPAALVFRHPTPESVAQHLLTLLTSADAAPPPNGAAAADPLLDELARLESALIGADVADGASGVVTARLERLLANWKAVRRPPGDQSAAERLEMASTEQVLDFIHNELGVS
jgi:hypothetical protein